MSHISPDQIPVTILGATGSVGQRFVQLLDRHPRFKVVALAGSDRSIGQRYGDVCRWILPEAMPGWAAEMTVTPVEPDGSARVAFSALPAGLARQVEPEFAQAGVAVCSNASAFRAENDVPLLLPEVNPEHVALVQRQRRERGWSGCIVTNPNCTST
ncbi:MAG: aspartate-semialdehyde dehydrogenase, partial [Chloroflexota bacterium]